MNNNVMLIGVGVLSFLAVNYLMNRKSEQFSNATGGFCQCANGTSGYCAGSCAKCCSKMGGATARR